MEPRAPRRPNRRRRPLWAQTRTRLARTPVAGFAAGTSCSAPTDVHSEDLEAIEVYWYRQPSGTYALRALASGTVVRVVYRVDGYTVGEATRGSGSNFPIDYSFSQASTERFFEVVGYSAAGQDAHGRGLLDVTDGTAVYIKQLGAAPYEIGLERAPDDIAFIKVDVDDRYTLPTKLVVNLFQLDSQSGATLAKWEIVTLRLQLTMQMALCAAL